MDATQPTDAGLVGESLSGNREAFGQIVTRYQSLIYSLAFSATGSFSQSEDLAQDTFITAWQQLPHLREHDKFRSWLCGIARNCINNFLRREGREPTGEAEPLDALTESHSPDSHLVDHIISREEEAILWRTLVRIPPLYREPLVLFYQEHQSVESVARALELSEETVHQRLSRGRKLLQEEVLAFIEGSLEKRRPQKAFTLAVIAALPLTGASSQAATVGATVTATKSGSAAGSAVSTGFLGLFTGLSVISFGYFVRYRAELDGTASDQERRRITGFYFRLAAAAVALVVAVTALIFPRLGGGGWSSRLLESLLTGAFVTYGAVAVSLSLRMIGNYRWLAANPTVQCRPVWEYRSRRELLGWPLVQVRLGCKNIEPVRAWFAVGEVAWGRLFAFGGIAIAPFSCGWIAVGLLPLGSCAFGLLSLGGFSAGVWAFGAVALGWEAFGACAVAWNGASGWLALAHHVAAGDIAFGSQTSAEAVQQTIRDSFFLNNAWLLLRYLALLMLIWVVPTFYIWRIQRAHNQPANPNLSKP